MSKKIVFFGNERLATGVTTSAPTFQALIAAGYEIAALVVSQDELGKSRQQRELEISIFARQHGVNVISPPQIKDYKDELASLEAEIGVLVAYGQIVPPEIIDIFPKGIINIHPSLLPKHRGSTPIESVILAGETSTGVSLMSLATEMDSGPVYAQESVVLIGNETKQALADQLGATGSQMVITNLPAILSGNLEPKPQDDSQATYDERITKDESEMDFTKPATRLSQEVRAFAGWPRSRAKIGATDVIVTSARPVEGHGAPGSLYLDGKQLGIYTAQGLLMIDKLIPAGKKEMASSAFLAGYKIN